MILPRLHYMRFVLVIFWLLGACLGLHAATTRYILEKEVVSSRGPDGRLSFSLGGILQVRVKEESYLRVFVRGAEGKVWIEPARVTLISSDGQQYPGGFTVCSVGQSFAEVLVQASFTFTVNAGTAFVPRAGDYTVKIEAMAIKPDGQSFLLEAESPLTVKELSQSPGPMPRRN